MSPNHAGHTHPKGTIPKIKYGSYTGDGTENRIIDVGFEVKFLLLWDTVNRTPIMFHADYTKDNRLGDFQQEDDRIELVEFGFKVNLGDVADYWNQNGNLHVYIAFG